MPTLIVDQPPRRFGGRIAGRVLIGRLPTNGVALTDSSVSRLHAWVAENGNGHHFVADTGSLTGTWVNGAAIVRRRDLVDGDVIKVGKTQIVYSTSDELPDGAEEIDLAGLPPVENVQDAGVLFDCPCGAPAWFKATAIGHTHQCRQCGRTVRIPGEPNQIAEEVSAPSIGEPGVPPPPPAPAVDPKNPMLLHEQTSSAVLPHREEHGLADSGIHAALSGEAMVEKPHDEAMIDDAYGLGSGLDFSEHSQVEAMLDDAMIPDAEAPAIKPPLFEQKVETIEPPEVAEAIEPHEKEEEVLDLSTLDATLEPTAEAEPATCSVCRSAIITAEEQTVCPSCGLTFHTDCWTENLGCSAYGCPQVNALKPAEPTEELTAPEPEPDAVVAPELHEEPAGFPWEFMFLFVSVIGALLGVLCYGVPAMIGLLGTLIYILFMQDSRRHRPVAWIAVLLCVAGIAAGMYLSHLYWKGWPPIGPWARAATTLHPAPGARR